jgi:GT2 family glycosyltransferase
MWTGMFEDNFPFKLGGDDLDMSYRVTKAGYMIGSAPNAVTYHSRKTWNSYKAVHDRAKRWGTMENFIVKRHPELYRKVIPKNYMIETILFIVLCILSLALKHLLPFGIKIARISPSIRKAPAISD